MVERGGSNAVSGDLRASAAGVLRVLAAAYRTIPSETLVQQADGTLITSTEHNARVLRESGLEPASFQLREAFERGVEAGRRELAAEGLTPGPDALAREDAARDVARWWSQRRVMVSGQDGPDLCRALSRLAAAHGLSD